MCHCKWSFYRHSLIRNRANWLVLFGEAITKTFFFCSIGIRFDFSAQLLSLSSTSTCVRLHVSRSFTPTQVWKCVGINYCAHSVLSLLNSLCHSKQTNYRQMVCSNATNKMTPDATKTKSKNREKNMWNRSIELPLCSLVSFNMVFFLFCFFFCSFFSCFVNKIPCATS